MLHPEQDLKAHAKSIGFDRIGITSSATPTDFDRYKEWIIKGFAADMGYLMEPSRFKKRKNLNYILPGVKSVIVGAVSYAPSSKPPSSNAKFGRYAWGEDYHRVVQEKLEELAQWLIKNTDEPFSYLTYVDTGPLLERSLAERAGVGWIGKNTCVMHETTGSYLYLGELLTTLELKVDLPAINRCGTCTRCIDACPTQALVAPYQLDSNRCISYQTIENRKNPIPNELTKNLNGWIAGCDICQEVCPWNQEALPQHLRSLSPRPHIQLTLEQAATLTSDEFSYLFGRTSLKRIGWSKLRLNAQQAL